MKWLLQQWIAGIVMVGTVFLSQSSPSYAVRPDEILSDPILEARAEAISRDIRCVVCQTESINDSDADIAHDLRVLVREQLKAGATDDQVRAFLVARYGDFVLLKPPLNAKTLLIWTGPFLLLLVAATGVVVFLNRARHREAVPLNAAEQARLQRFMAAHDGTSATDPMRGRGKYGEWT